MKYTIYSICIALSLFLTACSSSPDAREKAWKNSFMPRELPEEIFTLDLAEDEVVESKKGSVLFIPKDAFLDEDGKVWEGEAEMALTELNTMSEMLEHNISTSADGGALSMHGLIQIKAKGGGKALTINPASAPYIEIPVGDDAKDLMVYEGKEDKHGYIEWKKPEKAPQYLITQPFKTLDFLPKGFEETLTQYLPYKGYKTAAKHLKDSLYFALDNLDIILKTEQDSSVTVFPSCEGLLPSKVQTIQNKKFENTFLATSAFERRLKTLIAIGKNELLDLYTSNLDKNLWEIDQMVAEQLPSGEFKSMFEQFSAEKLTNVKNMDSRLANKLGEFYAKRLEKNQKELQKAYDAYQKELKKKSEFAEKKREEYRKLLEKRQRYRLRKHGIRIKKNSPLTLCQVLKTLEPFELDVTVENGKDFERVQVYVIDPSIKSLFAILSEDKVLFKGGYKEDWALVMEKFGQTAHIVGVAYKGGKAYFQKLEFQLQKENHLKLKFPTESISENDLKKELAFFDKGARKFNKVEVDLEYQTFFEEERKRVEKVEQEKMMMIVLSRVAFPSCKRFKELALKGRKIFEENCMQCHGINEVVVGPALKNLLGRRTFPWILQMIHYPQKLIDSGDPIAQAQYRKYKQYMPNHDFLTGEEIFGICLYIEQESLKTPDGD